MPKTLPKTLPNTPPNTLPNTLGRLLTAALSLTAALPLAAQAVVSPSDRALLEGASFTHYPLGRWNARMQQLHGDLPGGRVLTGHAYRRDAAQVVGGVAPFQVDLEVTLSVSSRTPAQASSTFANNTGTGAVTVLPRSIVAFPGTSRPALDPSPTFDLVIPYTTPFALPPGSPTLCVDLVLYGNGSPLGFDQNLSVYLDAHSYPGGANEQPGFRYGQGCAAPGNTQTQYATMSLSHLGTGMALDVASRLGMPDTATHTSVTLVGYGLQPATVPLPGRPECMLLTTTDGWLWLSTLNSPTGAADERIALPLLPPGLRIWCQAGSIDLMTGSFAAGDGSTIVVPGPAPTVVPAVRIANANDRNAATGTVSQAVPVTRFL